MEEEPTEEADAPVFGEPEEEPEEEEELVLSKRTPMISAKLFAQRLRQRDFLATYFYKKDFGDGIGATTQWWRIFRSKGRSMHFLIEQRLLVCRGS